MTEKFDAFLCSILLLLSALTPGARALAASYTLIRQKSMKLKKSSLLFWAWAIRLGCCTIYCILLYSTSYWHPSSIAFCQTVHHTDIVLYNTNFHTAHYTGIALSNAIFHTVHYTDSLSLTVYCHTVHHTDTHHPLHTAILYIRLTPIIYCI